MVIDTQAVQQLRERTGCGIVDCKKALETAGGSFEAAIEILRKKGADIAATKSGRSATQGVISSYVHPGALVGVLLKLHCETDFVARSADFQNLAHDLCLQIAALDPAGVEELLDQEYIRDTGRKVGDIVKEVIVKVGENVQVGAFTRYSL